MAVRGRMALAIAMLAGLVAASPASGLQHLMVIQEVYPGSTANPGSEFVELQMYTSNQNLVAGRPVRFYSATGAQTASASFSGNVANGQSQRSILIATTAAASEFGVTPDLTIGAGLDPAGGAACWDNFDCVSWGSFSGSLPSPSGTPEAAVADGNALCRSIASGSPSELEAGDDTNNSAADFLPTPPAPRNNASPAAGQPCPGDSSGGGGDDKDPPQTTITKAPDKKSDETTAKFKFRSDEAGSSFECKLDKGGFAGCDSPRRYKGLAPGRHKFRVRAIDRDGNFDPSPARYRFKVLAG